MKRYKKYMDTVEPSPELHEKLMKLEAQAKKPVWVTYGALAAAVVLVVGLGVFGVSRMGGGPELGDPEPVQCAAPMPVESGAAIGEVIMEGDYSGPEGSGTKTIGGFEVPGNGGMTVSYFMLPYIAYGDAQGESAASLAVPEGVERRELTEEEVLNLLGGEEALTTHLDWGGYDVHGYVMAYEDGSVWRAALFGKGENGYFTLTMCPDALPQDCCVVMGADVTTTDVWGVEVAGYYGGIYGEGENREVWLPESREVEFLANGVGCRFCFYGPEGESEMVETMVSRFVRLAVVDGLELNALVPGWEPESSEVPSAGGDSGASPSRGPAGEVSTPAYDPNGT